MPKKEVYRSKQKLSCEEKRKMTSNEKHQPYRCCKETARIEEPRKQYVKEGDLCRQFKDAVHIGKTLKEGIMYDFDIKYIEKRGKASQYMAEEFAYWMMEDPRYKDHFRGSKENLFKVGQFRVVY
ncbi:unnamed protein product [Cylicocyclus nassatus]|uniref:Uncharacterized protein n=1 Tax=Cylicocyclus nassatus TaxID=53992 RepID=A0AA36DS23_CYLNA|nr:unnamed protein product [Cylicocyclus nassatus]